MFLEQDGMFIVDNKLTKFLSAIPLCNLKAKQNDCMNLVYYVGFNQRCIEWQTEQHSESLSTIKSNYLVANLSLFHRKHGQSVHLNYH